MKKKTAALVLTIALGISLVACGNGAPVTQSSEVPNVKESVETQPEKTPVLESKEESEESSEPGEVEEVEEVEEQESSETPEEEVTESQAAIEEAAESSEETPAEPEAPTYTFSDKTGVMYAKSSVNVRDLPSTDGSKVGSLSTNDKVDFTGICNETGWYRFLLNGKDVYVSGNYLQSTKVQVATQAGGQGTSGSTSASQQAESAPSGTSSAGSQTSGSEQGSSSDVSWELIAEVEGGKIYQGSDGSQMSVSNSGVVDVTPAENIGGGDGFDWGEPTAEDLERTQQVQDLIDKQTGNQ